MRLNVRIGLDVMVIVVIPSGSSESVVHFGWAELCLQAYLLCCALLR